ncbi:MAG: divalent-cation tolerance protein CutA [Candidatus Omnitrophota bacterium]
MKNSLIFVMTGSRSEARKIARYLVKKRLAACVNIIAAVESIYTWKGKIESAREFMLIIKSTAKRFPDIEKAVKSLHSYECPEIIEISIKGGSRSYIRWISDAVS